MPGHSATVLVTLAAMAGMPIAVSAGKDISVPPPAIAFTRPAAIPARATRAYCSGVGVIEAGSRASCGDYVARRLAARGGRPAHSTRDAAGALGDRAPVGCWGAYTWLAPLFVASSTDPATGTGLADAIAARLGGQQALAIQRGRVGTADDGAATTHVLSGEVTRDGADVVVVARLADPAAGVTLWVERIRVHPGALFNAENVIAERVVAALRLHLAAAEQDRLRRRYTRNGAAYDEYLRGRAALVTYTPDGTRRAIESFERALGHDRGYALARAGLAMACADMCLRYAPAAEVEAWGNRAEAEARAALAADDGLAEAHLARAAVARKREFDWNATLDASDRALVLDPNLDQAHFFKAAAYYHLGYMEEALIELEKGRRLHGADLVEPMRIDASSPCSAVSSRRLGPASKR